MRLFVEEADRGQWTLLPECLDDFIDESNPVRVIDVFVDALDLAGMSFEGVEPAATGRPSYHPSVLLKLYIFRRSFELPIGLCGLTFACGQIFLEGKADVAGKPLAAGRKRGRLM
jgi:hypothetical protein